MTRTIDEAIRRQVESWPPLTEWQIDRLRSLINGGAGAPLPRLDSTPPPVRKCALYRYFDSAGALLYVGITVSPETRGRSHSKHSAFMEFVETQTVEWFNSEEEAKEAEKTAIRSESPLFNRVHADASRDARLFDYLADRNAYHLMRLP